jgi:hypothetical protein
MVTLATLRDGDNLSFTRLQELLGLTPGNLITHLRKLEERVTEIKLVNGHPDDSRGQLITVHSAHVSDQDGSADHERGDRPDQP